MINIFKRGYKTLTSDIETWVVRWNMVYSKYDYKEVAQFFTNKEEAKEFEDALRRANKLLGHTASHLTDIKCERVRNNGCE